MKYIPRYAALAACVLVLSACAAMGLIAPQSFEERLGAAYTSNTAIREAASNSLASHALSGDEGAYILAQTREARKLLDATKAVALGGDVATAEGRLVLVINGLTILRGHLEGKGIKVQEKPNGP